MAVVERGQLRLIEPLDRGQNAGVHNPNFQVGVGALQFLAALQVRMGWVLDAVDVVAHVSKEREPDVVGESLLAPVVKLAQDKRRDHKFLVGLGDQSLAGLVNAVSGIERRQERAGVEDERHL